MDEPATAETIIHALSQFKPDDHDHVHDALVDVGAGEGAGPGGDAGTSEVEDAPGQMSRTELEAEVMRLRGVVHEHGESSRASSQVPATLSPSRSTTGPGTGAKRPGQKASKGSSGSSKSKTDDTPVRLQSHTGKRVEKDRKTELYKAIRQTMRQTMGMINESDRLPPHGGEADVPDWLNATSPQSEQWITRVATQLHQDLARGTGEQAEASSSTPSYKVGDEDKAYEVILDACRVTFANYVKRYKSENDDTHAARKARYARNRRRWARKDLKQERRAKARAGVDDAHPLAEMDQDALHFDYQSSEYSSPGEDSDDEDAEDRGYHAEKVRRRAEIWAGMRQSAGAGPSRPAAGSGEYGWASGLGAKVLEIRTPSWRSQRLNEMYAELDSISTLASQQRNTPRSLIKSPADTLATPGVKPGHVAPSHHRFTLPPELRRRGAEPRQPGATKKKKRQRIPAGKQQGSKGNAGGGEGDEQAAAGKGWMWASGTVGVWPARIPL